MTYKIPREQELKLTAHEISRHELAHVMAGAIAVLDCIDTNHYLPDAYSRAKVFAEADGVEGQAAVGILGDEYEPGNTRVQALLAIGPVITHPEADELLTAYARTGKSGYMQQLIFGNTLSQEDIALAANWARIDPARDYAQKRAALGAHHLFKRLGTSGQNELCAVLRHLTSQEMTTQYLHEWIPEAEARRAMKAASAALGLEWWSKEVKA